MRLVFMIFTLYCLYIVTSFAQDYYFYGQGEKIYISKSDKWITFQVPEYERSNVQSILQKNVGFKMVREISPARGIFWIEKQYPYDVETALSKLKSTIEIIRTFPSFFSVTLNRDTAKYILFDEFVVKFHDEISKTTIDSLNEAHGVEIIRVNEWGEYLLRVREASSFSTLDLANLYYEQGYTKWSQPNFIADIRSQVDDTLYHRQWHLKNTGQTGGPSGVDINAEPAWSITTGDSDIIVAVVDDGVEMHEDFYPGQLVPGYTANNSDGTGTPSPPHGHGQAVSGILTANHNNLIGVRGVSSNSKIMSVKIFTVPPETTVTEYGIGDVIDSAWQHGAHILSNSWGYTHGWYEPVAAAINRAITLGRNGKGSFVVFASGNSNSSVSFPAYVQGVFAVGALSYRNFR